jgi:hypothetical protein
MDIPPVKQGSKHFLSEISNAIWDVRAPLFVAVVAGVTLSIDQIQEILFLFAEETAAWKGSQIYFPGILQIFFAVSLFLLFCLLLWRISNGLLSVSRPSDEYISRGARFLRRILPVIVAVIPLFSLYLGFEGAYSTWSIIPTQSEVSTPGAPKAPRAAASQIAQACKLQFPGEYTANRLRSTKHEFIRQELCSHLGKLSAPAQNLHNAATGTLIFASLVLLAGFLFAVFGPERPLSGGETSFVPRSLRWKWLWASTFIFFLGLFALQSQGTSGPWGVIETVPAWLGTSAIILLFLIYLVVFSSLLTRVYDRFEIPAVSILLIVALVASYEDWNNNHTVRQIKRVAHNPQPLSASFAAWVKNLHDNHAAYVQKFFKKNPANPEYPVFLFAMQGGGQYSSTFASLTLAKLFDRCPALRHHVFGLSGVSGGAVGAGFFVAQLKTELADPNSSLNSDRCEKYLSAGQGAGPDSVMGPLEYKISHLEQSDFLAPLASQGLFGDFLQRFIPWPALPFLDRGRAFEAGMEGAWRKINPGKPSPLEADFLEHWSPSGGVPMLLLNTTRVQTGEPILAAPFLTRAFITRDAASDAFMDSVPTNAAELRTIYRDALNKDTSIRLSTAMSLSARFPLVTPVGRLHANNRAEYFDLGDGGYFENSGADTISVMLQELAWYKNYPALFDPGFDPSSSLTSLLSIISFKVIVLNEFDGPAYAKAQTLNELASPFEALYRARAQRGYMAILRLYSNVNQEVIRISHDPFPLPLGWRLSQSKQDFISSMVGTPNDCDDSPDSPSTIGSDWRLVAHQYAERLKSLGDNRSADIGNRIGTLFYLMHRNRCVLRDVVREVQAEG